MPSPRYPSRVEAITFPVFGLSWFGNPADGTSIVAYCGGGGSAKTGVFNKICVRANGRAELEISTDDQVCVGIYVYGNPLSNTHWLVGAVGNSVRRYSLFERGTLAGTAAVGSGANAVATNAMANILAVGCEDGSIHIFKITDESNDFDVVGICKGHLKAVCSVSFCLRRNVFVSSAKDGMAKVWNYETLECIATLECQVPLPPPKSASKQRGGPQQILVRGCAFGDLEGNIIYTVASARRGQAYLYKWISDDGKNNYAFERIEASPVPISAMSLSADGGMLALGGVDGTIALWNTETLKVLKKFPQVHELPVTCIAARPYSTPLQGDEEGIVVHALSASADSKFALLTLQRRGPKKRGNKSSGSSATSFSVFPSTGACMWMALVSWVMYYVVLETQLKCRREWNEGDYGQFAECVLHTVLIAPPSRPGILVPPH